MPTNYTELAKELDQNSYHQERVQYARENDDVKLTVVINETEIKCDREKVLTFLAGHLDDIEAQLAEDIRRTLPNARIKR